MSTDWGGGIVKKRSFLFQLIFMVSAGMIFLHVERKSSVSWRSNVYETA
jgi:hypothetical protein